MSDFASLLRDGGLEPKRTKLLRHDRRGLAVWRMGREFFGSFLSVQSLANSPYRTEPEYAIHFVPGPTLANGAASAIFVGATRLLARRPWSPAALPLLFHPGNYDGGRADPDGDVEASDHEWLDFMPDAVGSLLIDWGFAPRSWHQWAVSSPKPIVAAGNMLAAELAGSTAPVLDAIARHEATLAWEEAEIARALSGNPESITRNFRERLVEERPRQTAFRQKLIDRNGAVCAITGCGQPEVLEAAHIVPFAEGHSWRDFASNGLLLRRDIHRLFDLFLIAVEPASQTIWTAPALRDGEYASLQGKEIETTASPSALGTHFHRACKLAEGS